MPFGSHFKDTEHDSAERELRNQLINWRVQLAAGADLNTTALRRRFPPRVFKHGQRPPEVSSMQKWWRRSLLYRWWKRYSSLQARYNSRKAVRVSGRSGRAKLET